MSWMQSFESDRPDLEKTIRAPIGAVSPLWWAFAGAATAGVAYWWLTRWAKPYNFEATGAPAEMAPALEEAAATYDLAPEAIEDVVDTPPTEQPLAEMDAQNEEAAQIDTDDLTQLVGVGPKLALALNERGIKTFNQIAEWTEDDLAYFDRELNLKGRAVRDSWVEQAKGLAGEAIPVLPD